MNNQQLEPPPIPEPIKFRIELVGPPALARQFLNPKRLEARGPHLELGGMPEVSRSMSTTHEQVFEREKASFARVKLQLLNDATYVNKYVAIINGKVADSDNDRSALAERVYAKHGYVQLFIGKVIKQKRYRELPSPERVKV